MKQRLLLFLLTIAIALFYFFLNRSFGPIHSLKTSIDDSIKLVPIFVIPYLLFVPIFWASYLYSFITGRGFQKFSWSIVTVYLISYAIFLVFETVVDRPKIISNDSLLTLVSYLYSHDQPYNAFPSLHVASSFLLAGYVRLISSRWSVATYIFALVVVISTLLTKQHYFLDVAGGILLGSLAVQKFLRS